MTSASYCQECRRPSPSHSDECSLASNASQDWAPPAPAPTPPRGVTAQLQNARLGDYRSPEGLGRFAFLGLVYLAAALGFSLFTAFRYRSVLVALDDGSYDGTFQEAIDIENAYAFSGLVDLLGIVVLAVTWLFWMRRLRQNVIALGRDPVYRPAWIFWGWIVPIMNYFRPYQVIKDLWRNSSPSLGRYPGGEPPRFVLAWWVIFVVTGRISVSVLRNVGDPETLDGLRQMVDWFIALDFLELVSIVLAAVVIRSLTQRQIDAAAALGRHVG